MSVTWGANWPTLTLAASFDGSTFVDISDYVRSCTIVRPSSRETGRYPAGTMTVTLDNRDARFSPFNLSGPYVSSGATQVLPDVRVTLLAEYGSSIRFLFCGHAEDWQDEYPEMGHDAVTVLTCVDPLAQLAATNRVAQASDGAGEVLVDRVARLIAANFPAPLGSTSAGSTPLQATDLGGNVLEECYLTIDSVGGAVWYDPQLPSTSFGGVVFEDAAALVVNTRSNTSQATFGAGGVGVSEFTTTSGRDQVLLSASYANVGGTLQTVGAGTPSRTRTDLIADGDPYALALANLAVAIGDPASAPRVTSVTVRPAGDPSAAWEHIIDRRIRDRVTVDVTIPASGLNIVREAFIDGISHQIDPMDWTTRYDLASTSAWDGFSASVFDTGVFDTAEFFY